MKKLPAIALVVLAILSAVAAVLYLTKTAGNLPHFFPAYAKNSSLKHTKHGLACVVLAVVFLIGAWMVSGKKSAPAKPNSPTVEQ